MFLGWNGTIVDGKIALADAELVVLLVVNRDVEEFVMIHVFIQLLLVVLIVGHMLKLMHRCR
jgi:hypothetical protein